MAPQIRYNPATGQTNESEVYDQMERLSNLLSGLIFLIGTLTAFAGIIRSLSQ